MRLSPLLSVPVGLALAVAIPRESEAQTVQCNTLPNPIYFPTTTLLKPFLAKTMPFVGSSSAGADQMTLIYVGLGSCAAYDFLADNADMMGTGTYWDAQGRELTCEIPAGMGIKADMVSMDVGRTTCRPDVPAPADTAE